MIFVYCMSDSDTKLCESCVHIVEDQISRLTSENTQLKLLLDTLKTSTSLTFHKSNFLLRRNSAS